LASPDDRKYTREHEWVTSDGTVGITDYAQDQLGDIVFVDLPDPGTQMTNSAKFGEIESVKAVSELFAPVGGEVIDRNEGLADNPQWVNDDPYGDGWMLKVKLSDPSELDSLMDAGAYEDFIKAESA
jgi:glycine cleavage system H protein